MIIKPSRLYLQKDENKQDVFIDFHWPLHQHQIDGLRLLYKLYKKKKPGAILNDPSGYGKCIQTVLFINAMRPLLNNRPVFILCNENDTENWKDHFSKWTDCSDDIAIESTNPFSKKWIYVKTVKDAYAFCRRHFSILAIHDNSFTKDTLQVAFKADFKIWLTSVDMKKNLQKFSLLYQWLYPSEKFKIEEFTPKRKEPKDILHKSIILDAFLEDIVIRRDDFVTPYKKRESYQPTILEPQLKRTRKNKDPTGTKVKRSKKQIIPVDAPVESTITCDNPSVSDVTNDFSMISTSTKVKTKSRTPIIDDNDNPIENTTANDTSISSRNSVKTKDYSIISTGTKSKRSKKLIIDDVDDYSVENTKDTSGNNRDVTGDSTDTDNLFNFITVTNEPKDDVMDVNNFICDEKTARSDRITDYASDENTQEYKLAEFNTSNDFRLAIDDLVENENKGHDNVPENVEPDAITPIEEIQVERECPNSFSICREMNAVIKENNSATQSNIEINNDICKDTVNIKGENGDKGNNHGIEDTTNDILKVNEADNCRSANVKSEEKPEGSEKPNNKSGHKDIYEQLAELEAQALKRFKGTYLDRLF